ncbi:MAG: exosortase T [bacterium]
MRRPQFLIPLVLAASAILAFEPVTWLWRTWTDPAWASDGEFVFLALAAVALWSYRSPVDTNHNTSLAWTWLGVSAVVRAVGNVLAVNVIGALMLCVDIFAVARMLRLGERKRRVSPAWLALAFAFSLPVERILQRLVGHALQWVSAQGAFAMLRVFEEGTTLHGVELTVRGVRVLVDLPCSGARGLMILTVAYVLLSAVRRPRMWDAIVGAGVVLAAGLAANTLRVFLLAEGIVHRDVLGLDVMSQPWHDLVGLFCLGAALAPVVLWSARCASTPTRLALPAPTPRVAVGMVVLGFATLAFAPARPIDVSKPVAAPQVPSFVAGFLAKPQGLTPLEQSYFTAYGGGASRATYGPFGVLLVRTSSPVRHLHSPEECMAGAGWDVQRIGVTGAAHPGATWRIARDGQTHVVRATYVSNHGQHVATLEHAIWMWLADPTHVWTAVERTYPPGADEATREAFDHEVFHRLNIKENP